MKLLLTLFCALSLLICASNAQDYLYSITPGPPNVLSIFDLVLTKNSSVQFSETMLNTYTVVSRYNHIVQLIASFDTDTISYVNGNFINGDITQVAKAALPPGVSSNQLSSFYTQYWDETLVYFISNVDNQVSLHSFDLNTYSVSTWSLFNQDSSSVVGVLDSGGNYTILSVVNNQYVAVIVDPSYKTVLQKIQVSTQYKPAQVFQLVSLSGAVYILELQGTNVVIQHLDASGGGELTQVGLIQVGNGASDINCIFNLGYILMTVTTTDQTILFTINNDDFTQRSKIILPSKISYANPILFDFY